MFSNMLRITLLLASMVNTRTTLVWLTFIWLWLTVIWATSMRLSWPITTVGLIPRRSGWLSTIIWVVTMCRIRLMSIVWTVT